MLLVLHELTDVAVYTHVLTGAGAYVRVAMRDGILESMAPGWLPQVALVEALRSNDVPQLRRRRPRFPVIALVAPGTDGKSTRAAGFDGWIIKPVPVERLVATPDDALFAEVKRWATAFN